MDLTPFAARAGRSGRCTRHATRALHATATAALGLTVAGGSAVTAAPDNANTFTLDISCADGSAFVITVLAPTPERAATHVVGSTSVIVPTRFQWHVVVTDGSGQVIDESTSPPEPVHGRSGEHLDTVECTFTQFAHHDWPDIGPVTIEVDGTVDAYVPR